MKIPESNPMPIKHSHAANTTTQTTNNNKQQQPPSANGALVEDGPLLELKKGETGFITAEMFKRHLPPHHADHEYFICGPAVMMDAIERALGELGVPMSKYH